MRLKNKTLIYLVLGGIYAITPSLVFGLLLGKTMPGYTVNSIDVALVFAFTFISFVVGFLGGEMYVDDMDESDPLYGIPVKRKK